MKRPHLILSHAGVFVGAIAVATMLQNVRSSPGSVHEKGDGSPGARASTTAGYGSTEAGAPDRANRTTGARASAGRPTASPREQLGSIIRIPDPLARQRALMDLIDALGPQEFAAIAEQYRSLDLLPDSSGEFDLLMRGWAKVDPLGALEYAGSVGGPGGATATILASWANLDATAAERWANEHHQGDGANPYMVAVIRGLAGSDLAHATQLAESMPLSRERLEAVDYITRALMLQGAEAAMKFPDTITDPTLRGGFVVAIANRLAGRDPEKTANWLAAMNDGEVQNRAARLVGEALARTDARAASEWVSTLKPEARAEAASAVIPIMSSENIQATAEWLSTMARTPGYDRMVEEFVWSCDSRAPEQSAAWIMGISNSDRQRYVMQRMLGEWSQRDPGAVRRWVAGNNVPPDIGNRFLR